jgi:hypothetical protein
MSDEAFDENSGFERQGVNHTNLLSSAFDYQSGVSAF